jgi:hypothetical protein
MDREEAEVRMGDDKAGLDLSLRRKISKVDVTDPW